jgi:hypothetical protein
VLLRLCVDQALPSVLSPRERWLSHCNFSTAARKPSFAAASFISLQREALRISAAETVFLLGPKPVPIPSSMSLRNRCANGNLALSLSILAFLSRLSFTVLPYYHFLEMYGYGLAIGFSFRLTYTLLIASAPCFERWRDRKLWRLRIL